MQQWQEAHGCVHLKHIMDIIHFLINANSIQIIVDAIIHRMTKEAMLLFCLVPALTIAVQRVRRVVHLTTVPALTTEVFVLLKLLRNTSESSESSMLFMTRACETVLYYNCRACYTCRAWKVLYYTWPFVVAWIELVLCDLVALV